MDIGTALSVAQTLFAALHCTQLRNVFSLLGYKKDELDNLAKTVETTKAVLLDAESMDDGLSHQAQCYVDELKYAIFEADDLLDEFVTLSERKHEKLTKGDAARALDKAHALFSRFKELPTAYNMSKQVKSIRKKLDVIADNHNKFGFKLDSHPIRVRREETCSYVYEKHIIGRDAEKEEIVNRLLQTNGENDVSFLTIVGIGGLGKTSLAQLVFNDDKIQAGFSERRWACVGDEDTKYMNLNSVLAKILLQKQEECTLELLRCKFQEELTKKKYLIILDDVWIEKREEWMKLEVFLKGGARGSWILVTTRSRTTATIIGDGSSYDLQGLSDDDSWRLFQMVAFDPRSSGQANTSDLVRIGRGIIEKCANVPLAIRVAGSLLYGQPITKWESLEESQFADFDPHRYGILPILKFSYYHLESPLKCCFSYCALFPKDYTIDKELLVRLWEAQGYIMPSGSKKKENVAEEYFSILLRRCFLEDVKKNKNGEIISFKIHDLMHDVAQQVAGKEISIVGHFTGELDKRIVHLKVGESISIKGNLSKKTVRTLLFDPNINIDKPAKFDVGALLENWTSLRALVLWNSDLKKIPDAIGKLLHLRLVDFSCNFVLIKLPKSFTKLHNLETLILSDCERLGELPDDIGKLVKLRYLDIYGCRGLHMPESIGKLTSLEMLPYFVVNISNSLRWIEGLEGLRSLSQLKGSLDMQISGYEDFPYVEEERGQGGVLINKQHLNHISLFFRGIGEQHYALFKRLQPHQNLKSLQISGYRGSRMPSWASEHKLGSSLSNLVILTLSNFSDLKCLSGMGKLQHLRKLEIYGLVDLEYIEESRNRSQLEEGYLFFPSLKILYLATLPYLKGWWRKEGEGDDLHSQPSPSFPHLSELTIKKCEELTLMPAFPTVENLLLNGVNERLRISVPLGSKEVEGPTCSAQCRLETDNVGLVKSLLSMKALRCLTELEIAEDEVVETLEEEEEAWQNCSSSLRILTIQRCSYLKSVYKGCLEHLSSLEELRVIDCDNMTLIDDDDNDDDDEDDGDDDHDDDDDGDGDDDDDGDGDDKDGGDDDDNDDDSDDDGDGDDDADTPNSSSSLCPPFSHTLRSVELSGLPELVNLPEWMQHLNSLQSLYIKDCESLESLPEWMQHLTSLTVLEIYGCSEELEQRCSSNLPGQYWPYICHIPNVKVSSQ